MTIFDVLNMIGGLCLFLFGMAVMGDGLERRAGNSLKVLLDTPSIALCIIDAVRHNMNAHEAIRRLRKNNPVFEEQYISYSRKYTISTRNDESGKSLANS